MRLGCGFLESFTRYLMRRSSHEGCEWSFDCTFIMHLVNRLIGSVGFPGWVFPRLRLSAVFLRILWLKREKREDSN